MRARREQRHGIAAFAEMLAHHRRIGLEAAAGEHDGIGGQRLAGGEADAGDRVILGDQRIGRAAEAEDDTGLARGTGQLAMDGLAAADGLDARRAFRQIIDRLVERHAVAGDPFHRGGRVCGQRGEVALVALELRRLQHVVDERRLDAIDRRHPHVGRRPAGVAAGVGFGRFVDQRDLDGDVFRTRLFSRRERRRQSRGALADDDDVFHHFGGHGPV